MSDKIRTIDARGLACPGPVIQTKKAIEEGGFEELQIIVDNPAARDNVSRFVAYAKASLLSVTQEGNLFTLRVAAGAGAAGAGAADRDLEAGLAAACEDSPASLAGGAAGVTVFIPSAELGRGEPALGALLMKGFIYSLAEAAVAPKRIIFMNSGVKLCVEGSESLSKLKSLAGSGVEILACGTCLDFYKIKEQLAVGRISNMYEISNCLLEGRTLAL